MGKKKSPKQRELEQNKNVTKDKPKKLSGVRILALVDSPRVATGFSKVGNQLLQRFAREDAMIDIIAINDMGGWYHPEDYPFRIYPAMPGASQGGDVYGRTVLQQALSGKHPDLQPAWDLIWVLTDHFILEQRMGGVFAEGTAWFINKMLQKWRDDHDVTMKSMLYTPVDSVMKENWVTDGILPFDKAVSYTEYGKDEMKKAVKHELIDYIDKEIPVIPHGVELDVFKPEKKEDIAKFRQKTFGKDGWLKEHDFLLVSVNRNQPRKDLARTLEVFKQFNKKVPDSKLYIHCAAQDAGGNLLEMARCCGLDTDLLRCPTNWDAQKPYPVEYVNMIYNSADVVMSTHLGEGWGFSLTEGMSCERPVIFHNITSITEILGFDKQGESSGVPTVDTIDDYRGLGVGSSDFVCLGVGDLERMRPVASVDDFVNKLLWVYENEELALQMGKNGRKWLTDNNMDWDTIADIWIKEIIELLKVPKEKTAIKEASERVIEK